MYACYVCLYVMYVCTHGMYVRYSRMMLYVCYVMCASMIGNVRKVCVCDACVYVTDVIYVCVCAC